MCGVFAAINLDQRYSESEYQSFINATNMVNYRGPDSQGYKTFAFAGESSENTFSIFLGHRRLSIIDLTNNGCQPMDCDGVTIVFNGEIFNYLELRKELVSA